MKIRYAKSKFNIYTLGLGLQKTSNELSAIGSLDVFILFKKGVQMLKH
ncbi:hypothetical protein ACT1UF_07785 [Clostridium septicum]